MIFRTLRENRFTGLRKKNTEQASAITVGKRNSVSLALTANIARQCSRERDELRSDVLRERIQKAFDSIDVTGDTSQQVSRTAAIEKAHRQRDRVLRRDRNGFD